MRNRSFPRGKWISGSTPLRKVGGNSVRRVRLLLEELETRLVLSTADGNGPVVTALTEALGSPALTVTFDGPLALPIGALSVQDLANFQVNQLASGVNPELITTTGAPAQILSGVYTNTPSSQVTLTLANPLATNVFNRIFINGTPATGLVGGSSGSSAGIYFDGDNDDTSTGDFYALFAVGTSVPFTDSQGDQVTVSVTGPSAVNVWRELNGDVDQLSVVSPGAGSTLSGTVVPATGSTGKVYVGSVTIPVATAFLLNGATNSLPPAFVTPVDFTGDLTSGSNVISNVSSTAGLTVGQVVVGAEIPVAAGTVIAALGANSITLNQSALATAPGLALAAFPATIQASFTGDTTTGSAVITNIASTAGLAPGQAVTDASGANISAGATILSVSAHSITLSPFGSASQTTTNTSLTAFTAFTAPPASTPPVAATLQNLPYTLSITPVTNDLTPLLPGVQGAVFAQAAPTATYPKGLWLVFGGRTNGMHNFNPSGVTNFPPDSQNLDLIVINPATWETLVDVPWSQTDVPLATFNSLNSVAQEYYQQGDTLYAVGGYSSPIVGSFTGDATTGSPIITNVSDVADLTIGQSITAAGIQGASIPVGATILAVGANTITLDEDAVATTTGLALTAFSATTAASFTGDTTDDSFTVANVSSVNGLVVGQSITGAGIEAGTTITAIGDTTVTLSLAAMTTATAVPLTAFIADFTTYDTLTSLSVSGMANALINHTSVTAGSGIQQISDPRFAVTGGEMLANQGTTYLVLGQTFQGGYAFPPTALQTYTNEIRSFQISTSPTLAISNYQALRDPVNFRRRDGNAGPTLNSSGQTGLSYFGGVFTEPTSSGYGSPIAVDSNGVAQVVSNYQQFFSQYHTANVPLFDASTGSMFTIFLGGIGLYYNTGGQLTGPSVDLPFVDAVTSFATSANGSDQEFIMSPLPGLFGAEAGFFASPDLPSADNGVIQLDQLTGPTIVGYMFGGIFSQVPDPGGSGPGQSGSSNQVFAITVTPTLAPAVTSASSTTFDVFSAHSFTVTATGTPTPTLSETGALPPGVTFNAATGVLSGTPNTPTSFGVFPITFTASNGVGSNAVQQFTLTVSGIPAYATTPNDRYVAQMYLDLLGRVVDQPGMANWSGQLNVGVAASEVVLEIELCSSNEYQTVEVQNLYAHYLRRSADSGGLQSWITFLNAGGTVEQVASGLVGSPEYFQHQGGGANDGFLTALYQDVLDRAIDPNGQAFYSNELNQGTSRQAVASSVLTSMEGYQVAVEAYYMKYLGRAADSAGLNHFVQELETGATDQEVIASIVGSSEYQNTRVG